MMNELDELRLIIEELHAGLDKLPYHVFLGAPESASGDELRAAFHVRAQQLHPDRFWDVGDEELRKKVYAVYKRITEAYRVLGHPDARKRYDDQRAQGKMRLLNTERTNPFVRLEDAIADPTAKKYFGLALAAERGGDARAAKLNLHLALQIEPDNFILKAKMEKYK